MKIKSITIKCDALLLKQRKIGISDRRYPVIMGVPFSNATAKSLNIVVAASWLSVSFRSSIGIDWSKASPRLPADSISSVSEFSVFEITSPYA